MVETGSDIRNLAPQERLKHLRAIEDEKRHTLDEEIVKKRKELEEELAKKKEELEALEERKKAELEEAEELEQQTARDVLEEREQRRREVKALEARIKEFSEGNEFVAETGKPEQDATITGLYHAQAPEEFRQAQEGIDYLLNATPGSEERKVARERNLYESVRTMAEGLRQGRVEEGYAFNQLQDQVNALRQREGDNHGYLSRIANVLNGIIDYRQEDERRKKEQ